MHIAPIVVVAHRLGPAGWESALERIHDLLAEHPDLPVTIRFPGAAIDHLRGEAPSRLASVVESSAIWLAGGWSDPILADLPVRAGRNQIDREAAALDSAGIAATGLWLGDAWEPGMVTFANKSGFRFVYVDASVIEDGPASPGVVERAGETVVAVPVSLAVPAGGEPDDLVAVRCTPDELEQLFDHRPRLTDPESYWATHQRRGKLHLGSTRSARTPANEVFYRKLLALISDQNQRKGALESVLTLASREFTAGELADPQAQADIVSARAQIDRLRHRGDSWIEVNEVDWDADGHDETVIETARSSLVIDPNDGVIRVWDDKTAVWPIVTPGEGGGIVINRQITATGDVTAPSALSAEERSQTRSEAAVTLTGKAGTVARVRLDDRTLELTVTSPDSDAVRFGPEIPVSFDADSVAVRVDGGDWVEVDEPRALSGHRFRLRDQDRSLLISSARPAEVFVRPGAESGVVVWVHWVSGADSTCRLTLTPQ